MCSRRVAIDKNKTNTRQDDKQNMNDKDTNKTGKSTYSRACIFFRLDNLLLNEDLSRLARDLRSLNYHA